MGWCSFQSRAHEGSWNVAGRAILLQVLVSKTPTCENAVLPDPPKAPEVVIPHAIPWSIDLALKKVRHYDITRSRSGGD